MGNAGGFFDAKLKFSDEQAVTSSAASAYEIDTEEADANLGEGTPLEVVAVVTTTFLGATSMTVELQDSAAGSSYATKVQTYAITEDLLVEGASFKLRVPDAHLRFLQLYYTVVGPHTSGNITAYLQPAM